MVCASAAGDGRVTKHMTRFLVVLSLLVLVAGGAAWVFIRGRSGHDPWFGSRTDSVIRSAVANVCSAQVAAIKLDVPPDMLIVTANGAEPKGLSLQPGFRYEKRNNRKAIVLLLEGLKKATRPPQYHMDRMCNVQIELISGKTIGPFVFGNHRFADCISREFIAGLNEAGIRSLPHR